MRYAKSVTNKVFIDVSEFTLISASTSIRGGGKEGLEKIWVRQKNKKYKQSTQKLTITILMLKLSNLI